MHSKTAASEERMSDAFQFSYCNEVKDTRVIKKRNKKLILSAVY